MQRPGAPLSYSAEKELRKLLEGKEAKVEQQRRRSSQMFSWILILGFLLTVLAIFLFPDKPRPATKAKAPAPVGIPTGQMPQVFAPIVDGQKTDKDLNSFSVKPGQLGGKEDVRFVMDLLNFSHAADNEPASAKPVPAAAPAAQTSKVEKPAVRK